MASFAEFLKQSGPSFSDFLQESGEQKKGLPPVPGVERITHVGDVPILTEEQPPRPAPTRFGEVPILTEEPKPRVSFIDFTAPVPEKLKREEPPKFRDFLEDPRLRTLKGIREAAEQPIVDPEALDQAMADVGLIGPFGIHRGAAKVLAGMTSPANLAIMAASGGTYALAARAGANTRAALTGLQGALSGYFGYQLAKGAQETLTSPEAREAYEKGDWDTLLRIGGETAMQGVLATLAVKHVRAVWKQGNKALWQKVDEHNRLAQDWLEQQQKLGQHQEWVERVFGEPIPVAISGKRYKIETFTAVSEPTPMRNLTPDEIVAETARLKQQLDGLNDRIAQSADDAERFQLRQQAKKTENAIANVPHLQPGLPPQPKLYSRVIDDVTGKVRYAGSTGEVQGWLRTMDAKQAGMPRAPQEIVQRATEAADRTRQRLREIVPDEPAPAPETEAVPPAATEPGTAVPEAKPVTPPITAAPPATDEEQNDAYELSMEDLAQRVKAVRSMQRFYDSGADVPMGQTTMRATTPEQRRQMLKENIDAHRQMMDEQIAQLEKDFPGFNRAQVLADLEEAADKYEPKAEAPAAVAAAPAEQGPEAEAITSIDQARGIGAAAIAADEPSAVYRISPGMLDADAVRFQYKAETGGKAGVGDELKDVKKWDPIKGGVLLVWVDPENGKLYVLNGHHRLELAKRLGANAVDVRFSDARTANEARAQGALLNIAEGRGTAIDAAKLFRESKFSPEDLEAEGISLKGHIARQGMGLSRLAQPLFDRVVAGDLPVERASIIGDQLPEHKDQIALVAVLDKLKSRPTNEELKEMIRMTIDGPKRTETTASLFGEEETTRNLILEKAQVSQYIRSSLSKEKGLFSAVGTEGAAGTLAQGGNTINPEESRKRAHELAQVQMLYDKFSVAAGPISDILNEAAGELADGKNANEVKQQAYERVREHLSRALAGGTQSLFAKPGEAPASASGSNGAGGAAEEGEAEQQTPEVTNIKPEGGEPGKGVIQPPSEQPSQAPRPDLAAMVDAVYRRIESGEGFKNNPDFWKAADEAFGGTRASGTYTARDAYDALEAAVNRWVGERPELMAGDPATALATLRELLLKLPTQVDRDDTQITHQQFSTPPTLAFVAAKALDVQPGDIALEPSAGTGSLATFARLAGATVQTNEIDSRRTKLLKQLGFEPTNFNAEQYANLAGKESIARPTVVIMNPPFSSTAGRLSTNDNRHGFRHVDQALVRLQKGGRAVIILGRGAALDAPSARAWWVETMGKYTVRANVSLAGKEYAKYGTTFDNQLIVIDKTGPTHGENWAQKTAGIIQGEKTFEEVLDALGTIPARQRSGEGTQKQTAGGSLGNPPGSGVRGSGAAPAETPGRGPVRQHGPGQGDGGPAANAPTGEPEVVPPVQSGDQLGEPGERGPVQGSGGAASDAQSQGVKRPRTPEEVEAAKRRIKDRLKAATATAPAPQETPVAASTTEASAPTAPASRRDTATPEQLAGARQRIRERLRQRPAPERERESLSHLKPEVAELADDLLDDLILVGYDTYDRGAQTLDAWSDAMKAEFGEEVEPYLDAVWDEMAAQPSGQTGPEEERKEESGGTFTTYSPAKVRHPKKHPAKIVEASSMAAVDPPDPHYTPILRPKALEFLSDLQMETPIYAGQRHEQRMPNGARAGFFNGDGTGVGKGAQNAAVALDNWMRGRRKIIWVSASSDLIKDAQRDLNDVGAPDLAQSAQMVNDFSPKEDITLKQGVIFTTYTSLPKRLEQLMKWLNLDEKGEGALIIFDEAHKAKNAVGDDGEQSDAGKSVVEIQEMLPNARVLYSSATGATEPKNMGYMNRLGLWGRDTSFPSGFQEFLAAIEGGGVAAMEAVARDMKALGMYVSRNISFEGVEYSEVIHELTPQQRGMYDTAAGLWQVVLQDVGKAMQMTETPGRRRGRVMAQFWAGHQRFFNSVITAMKAPTVISATEEALGEGKSVVVSLIGTNEAATARKAREATAEGLSLDDLDFSPKEMLFRFINNLFPTEVWEEYEDEDGNKRSRQVVDANGQPVHDQEALELKQALLDSLDVIHLPENPLDLFINHFGADRVAELTGRKKKLGVDPESGRKALVKRAGEGISQKKANIEEMKAFQEGKKRVAVISRAASMGISLHADLRAANQERRVQITWQLDWSADNTMQSFGRTHRSNQVVPPEYILISSDVGGEKRFSSTVARRLASLGALTKGQRDATGGGELAKYNFESEWGQAALEEMYRRIRGGEVLPGLESLNESLKAFLDMGLARVDEFGAIELLAGFERNIPKFLNRILSLEVDRQNAVFSAFTSIFEDIVQRAKEDGTFNEGVSNIKGARSIEVVGTPTVVHRDHTTGAETKHYALKAHIETEPVSWEQVAAYDAIERTRGAPPGALPSGFFVQGRSGNIVYAKFANTRTDPQTGVVERRYNAYRPHGKDDALLTEDELRQKFIPSTAAETAPRWRQEVAATPETKSREFHLISGAILPIWGRLHVRGRRRQMVRATTDTGQRIVGALIPNREVGEVLANLGVQRTLHTPRQVFVAVLDQGATVKLVQGLELKKTRFKGDDAIELIGADPYRYKEFRDMGLINEQVFAPRMRQMFLVPTNEQRGLDVLDRLLKRYPAMEAADTQALHAVRKTSLPFATALQSTVEKLLPFRASAAQVLRSLRDLSKRGKSSVGSQDLTLTGLDEWLAEKGDQLVGQAEVLGFLEDRVGPLEAREDSPLFARARIAGPAWRDGITWDEILLESQAYHATVKGIPVVFVNAQGMELLHELNSQKDGHLAAGSTYNNRSGRDMVRDLGTMAERLEAAGKTAEAKQARAIEKVLRKNRKPGEIRPMVAVQAGPGMSEATTTAALEEELDHFIQLTATGGVYADHLGGQLAAFMADSLAKKAAKAIRSLGYWQASDAGISLEIGARLMRHTAIEELGLTPDEAVTLAVEYIAALELEHGTDKVVPVTERVYSAFRRRDVEAKAAHARGHRRSKPEPDQVSETEKGKRERGLESRTPQHVRAGAWERPLVQAKQEGSAEYLGAGFGAVQPAYEKYVAPVLAQTGTTLAEVADFAKHALAPRAGVSEPGLIAMMKMKGEREHRMFILEQTMGAIKEMFASMPRPAQLDFLDRIKEGRVQPTPELQNIADLYRTLDDAMYAEVTKYRPNLTYKDNHFRIFWRTIPGPLRLDTVDKIEDILGNDVTDKRALVKALRGVRGPQVLDLIVADGKIDGKTAASYLDDTKHGPNGEPLLNGEGRRAVRQALKYAGVVKTGFVRLGRRPLQGTKGFLKRSTLANVSEGIEKGGEPVSYNPQVLFELGINDAMRFVTAQKMWAKLKAIGMRKFVRNGDPAPEGYVRIDDAIARVYYRPDGVNVMVPTGEWYVEENVARLLNNYLSRDKIRENPVGRGLMWFKNLTTALELAISPFHAMFETIEAMGSHVGVASLRIVNQGILQGDPQAALRGLRDMLYTPAAPAALAREGENLIRYVRNKDEFLATARGAKFAQDFPEIDQLIEDLFTGGGKLAMHEDYKIKTLAGWKENLVAVKNGSAEAGDYIGAVMRAVPSLNELAMKPLFEIYIPRLKIGLFLHEYSQQLEQYAYELAIGKMRRETLARETWDRTENKFGEMNFDNLFWNRTLKTALQMAFRSVTWKLGNVRGFGGAFAEQSRLVRSRKVGLIDEVPTATGGAAPPPKKLAAVPYLSPGAAWAFIGLPIISATLANVIQLYFGQGMTHDLTDVLAPRIGGVDERGKPRRVNILTYLKDVKHFFHNPVQYVIGSLSSMMNRAPELFRNRDYFGNFIVDPDAPFYERWIQGGMYAVGQPFVVSQMQRTADLGGTQTQQALQFLGFTRAASDIDMSPAERKAAELSGRKKTPMKPGDVGRRRAINVLASKLRSGEPGFNEALQAAINKGLIRQSDEKLIREHAITPYLVRMFTHLGVEDALLVWSAASEQERALLRDRFERKEHLIDNIPADRREAVRRRFNKALGRKEGMSRSFLPPVPGAVASPLNA